MSMSMALVTACSLYSLNLGLAGRYGMNMLVPRGVPDLSDMLVLLSYIR